MNIPLCVKCGSPAAFQKAVKEPYTCVTCQRVEQSRPPATGDAKAVVSSELVVLRREQSERVMPMIGGLLDAWDQLSNDMKHDDDLTSVREYLERIDAAMEGQQHNSD